VGGGLAVFVAVDNGSSSPFGGGGSPLLSSLGSESSKNSELAKLLQSGMEFWVS
jgi:hypothetical protein